MSTQISKGKRKMCFDVFRDGNFHGVIGRKVNARRNGRTISLVIVELPIAINEDSIPNPDRWLLFEMTTGKILVEQIDEWLSVRAYITAQYDNIVKYLDSMQGHRDADRAFVYRLKKSENEYSEMKMRYIRRDHISS